MTRAQGGLGIGLSLVRCLVELHGGTVSVASAGIGRGATFTLYFPYQPPDAVHAQAWTEHSHAV
jgi:signal transduction histidine kinase